MRRGAPKTPPIAPCSLLVSQQPSCLLLVRSIFSPSCSCLCCKLSSNLERDFIACTSFLCLANFLTQYHRLGVHEHEWTGRRGRGGERKWPAGGRQSQQLIRGHLRPRQTPTARKKARKKRQLAPIQTRYTPIYTCLKPRQNMQCYPAHTCTQREVTMRLSTQRADRV